MSVRKWSEDLTRFIAILIGGYFAQSLLARLLGSLFADSTGLVKLLTVIGLSQIGLAFNLVAFSAQNRTGELSARGSPYHRYLATVSILLCIHVAAFSSVHAYYCVYQTYCLHVDFDSKFRPGMTLTVMCNMISLLLSQLVATATRNRTESSR
jgi:hypothetical protein